MPSKLEQRQRWAANIMAGKEHTRPFPWTAVKQAIEALGIPKDRVMMQDIPALRMPETPDLLIW